CGRTGSCSASQPSRSLRSSLRKLAWTASADSDTIPTTSAVAIAAVSTQKAGVPRRARPRGYGEGEMGGRAADVGVLGEGATEGANERAGVLTPPPARVRLHG